MQIRILLLALLCCLTGSAFAGEHGDDYTLYLVRHAEKQTDGSRDPNLTEAGEQRAKFLAAWLKDKEIEDIWSSGYRRTVGTAQPLASELGLLLNIYDPGNPSELVERLLDRQDNALVVGHSNTIPELARMLCGCAIADIDESEYDRLIMITIETDQASAETLNQTDLFQLESKE